MTDNLRTLQRAEYNRDRQSLILTWMFRGVEDQVRVPHNFASRAKHSQRLLVPADELGIPLDLAEAVYVEAPGQLCFTLPGYSRTVFSQRLLNPEVGEPFEALRSQKAVYPASNPDAFPQLEMEAEVVALSATRDSVFVLTRERGRIPENTMRLHRLGLDTGFGVRKPTRRSVSPLAFPTGRAPVGSLRMAVSSLPSQETLFLAGPDGTAYSAPLQFEKELVLERLSEEAWSLDAGLPFLYAPSMARALEADAMLVVLDGERGELHQLCGTDGRLRMIPLTYEGTRLPRAASVSAWRYNVRQHFPETLPGDLEVSFLVVASPSTRRLWTVSLKEPRVALPLIGGGANPFYPGAVPQDLLNIDIGPVDRVVVIPHAGILFGTSRVSEWRFLLSPAMLSMLDPNVLSSPSKGTSAPTKAYVS